MKILKTKKYSILKNLLKYSFVIVFIFSLAVASVFATTDGVGNTGGDGVGNNNTGNNSGEMNLNINTTIDNPLNDKLNDIPSFIQAILEIVLTVGIPIVTLAIIYSGFLFVSAQGSPEKLTKAKNTLMYTLIGAALLLGAFVLAEAIQSTVEEIKTTT